MVKEISDDIVRLVLGELLRMLNDEEELEKALIWLSSALRTGYRCSVTKYAECVLWYNLDAVDTLNESGRDASLVAVLSRIKGRGQNLRTVGQICSLTETGFIQAGHATVQDIQNFGDWVRSTIPDKSWIMLQVFHHCGLHEVDRHAMIHSWLDVELR